MGNLIILQMPVGRGRRWAGRRRGGNDAGDVEIKYPSTPPPPPPPPVPMLPWARQLQMLKDPISSPGCERKQHRSADCFSSGGNDKHAAEQQSEHTVIRCKRWERERKLPDGRRYLPVVIADAELTAGFGRVAKQSQRAAVVHVLEQI